MTAPPAETGGFPDSDHVGSCYQRIQSDADDVACGVVVPIMIVPTFVGKMRDRLRPVTANVCSDDSTERTYTTKRGTTSTIRTGNVGRDKRQAVTKLLSDDEWSHWSDREIARQCRVSEHTGDEGSRETDACHCAKA
jgi:hypothetical protein